MRTTDEFKEHRAFRIQPSIYNQVLKTAERMNINQSEYIRRALVEQLARDTQDSA
jgi:hypothetical protein